MSQCIAALAVALFGGQPLTVALSTAPQALFIKVLFGIADANNIKFEAMYAWTGLWYVDAHSTLSCEVVYECSHSSRVCVCVCVLQDCILFAIVCHNEHVRVTEV